jgi:hypothetical protein
MLDYSRPGGVIREKWRILDGKGGSVMDHKFEALLSVVAQAFVLVIFICMYAGEDGPPSSTDDDEGCQCEVQTNEGWVAY